MMNQRGNINRHLNRDTYNSAKIAAELAWGTDLSISKYIGVSQR